MKAYPFLHKHPTTGNTTMSDGMDLRDWFAGQALLGLLASDVTSPLEVFVKQSYRVADAMIQQREVKEVSDETN
jgi:hypothetical protein